MELQCHASCVPSFFISSYFMYEILHHRFFFFLNLGNFFAIVTLQVMLSMFCCIIETCTMNTNLSESETLELVCEESVLFLPVRPPRH